MISVSYNKNAVYALLLDGCRFYDFLTLFPYDPDKELTIGKTFFHFKIVVVIVEVIALNHEEKNNFVEYFVVHPQKSQFSSTILRPSCKSTLV